MSEWCRGRAEVRIVALFLGAGREVTADLDWRSGLTQGLSMVTGPTVDANTVADKRLLRRLTAAMAWDRLDFDPLRSWQVGILSEVRYASSRPTSLPLANRATSMSDQDSLLIAERAGCFAYL
jgi:hypothetical protein